jgi:hypothetical protein
VKRNISDIFGLVHEIFGLVQVMEPPSWLDQPEDQKGVEQASVTLHCSAEGSPHPYYTWTDRTGNDVTRKPGELRQIKKN